MQKMTSKYLCFSGLKWYKENEPETYQRLLEKYLTGKMKSRNTDDQIYYIAHNIRNTKSNTVNNRRRFERRNYNPSQLQLNFNY